MENKILSIMKEVLDEGNLDVTCSQETCENWDSLHHLMLMSELEDAFDVELDLDEMAQMKSFAEIKLMLESKF